MTDADRVTDLLITLREAGIQLAELSVQKPTLDEVFLSITGRKTSLEDETSATSNKSNKKEKLI
jgi:ABC-2 type transport system ATP-binding protein